MEANTSHLINSDNRSTEESSLLMLNDDCFMKIFELLQPSDFVNLAKTCDRLYSVALDAAVKLKGIEFVVSKTLSNDKVTRSNEQFSDILTMFGRHVTSIKIVYGGSDFVLDKIRDNCEKMNRLELYSFVKLPSQRFNNLRELKIYGLSDVGIDEFRNVFTSNPNIERLEVVSHYQLRDGDTMSKFFGLLHQLPKLKILELKNPRFPQCKTPRGLLKLARLPHLTKLSLSNFMIEDTTLEELAAKSNLVELELQWMDDMYNVIKAFKNPESLVFPPKLKLLRFSGTEMSCSQIITIVKQLEFLQEFDLGRSTIWYRKRDEVGNYESEIVSRIADEIGERSLKIIYPDVGDVKDPFLYDSNHLQIIPRHFWPLKKARKHVRIPNVFLHFPF